MQTPLSNRPKITNKNIIDGQVIRYFTQHISTKAIIEIDSIQYEIFKNNPIFQLINFPWLISGLANDTIAVDGKIIYGVKHRNTVSINFYNERMPGLSRLLRNPLEYFQGVDNRTE